MKQLTLTKIGTRILDIHISGKEKGFKPRDSRKWDRIAEKLLSAAADYDEPVQALFEEASTVANSDLGQAEREDEMRRINREVREFDDTLGADEITVVLEDAELSFITGIWWELEFPGDRRTRALTSAISDALDAAIEVKIEDGRVVPVEKKTDTQEAPGRR